MAGLVDEADDPRPTRIRRGPAPRSRGQSIYREPPPGVRLPPPGAANDGDTEIPLEADTTVTIDAETGAAVIEEGDGSTILDFSGKDSAKEKPGIPPQTGFDANLALDPGVPLASLAQRLLEGIAADLAARKDWEEMGNKGGELLGVKWEEATTEVSADGAMSKTHHPMLMEAILRSWANAVAELLPSAGPVKVRDDLPTPDEAPPAPPQAGIAGPQPPLASGPMAPGTMAAGKKRTRSAKADALEKDFNHNLTVADRGYYADFRRMLLMRALKGSQFRKVYVDPILRRPLSRWVQGTDLIISNDATSLSDATRVTERCRVRQAVVRRMQVEGAWRDVKLTRPTSQPSSTDQAAATTMGITATQVIPADYLHEIYECSTDCDEGVLAKDENGEEVGYPLPYRVTIDRDSRQILAIQRNWKEGDDRFLPRQRYVAYGMVPGLSGPYDWGFVHLIGNLQRGTTAITREFIDAEMFGSFPGGVMQKGPGLHGGRTQIRVAPGEFQVIDTGGAPIEDFVKEWPYKGSSAKLPDLLQMLTAEGRRLAGTLEMPVGEGRVGNVPVGTMLAFVDSISKVPSAIHKGDHESQQQEYLLLKELFEEHPETFQSADDREWTAQELADQDLVPAADPNTPSAVHRFMQGTALVELANMPVFAPVANPRGVWARALRILGIEDQGDLTKPEQQGAPPPDPKAMAAMAKAQNDADKNRLAAAKLQQESTDTQRQAATDASEAEQRQADRESQERVEQTRLAVEETRARRELAHEHAMGTAEHQRGILGEALEHVRHGQTLEQEDRHHADEMAQASVDREQQASEAQQDREAQQNRESDKDKGSQ